MDDNQTKQGDDALPDSNEHKAVMNFFESQYQALLKDIDGLSNSHAASPSSGLDKLEQELNTTSAILNRTLIFNQSVREYLVRLTEFEITEEDSCLIQDIFKEEKMRLAKIRERQNILEATLGILEGKRPTTVKVHRRSNVSQPPLNAKFLLYLFLDKRDREVGLGDAIEDFAKHLKMFGRRRATWLFYQQIWLSAWPFIRRVISKVGGLILLSKWLRKF